MPSHEFIETVYKDFKVYSREDSSQFFHIDISSPDVFYNRLFDFFFSEESLLKYIENISSISFKPTKKNYTNLFRELVKYIDKENTQYSPEDLNTYFETIKEVNGRIKNINNEEAIRLDKLGKIGEYIFCCILSDYFGFDCILHKLDLLTNYNMPIYGIDTLFYSQTDNLLLFGESKVSNTIDDGINLINNSLSTYEKQIQNEYMIILSKTVLQNKANIFTKQFGTIAEECLTIEEFIQQASIKKIGVPIFIAHGNELDINGIFNKLKNIKKTNFLTLDTIYFLITLPIIDKLSFAKKFTYYINKKLNEYQNLRIQL